MAELITDEIVEAAARAVFDSIFDPHRSATRAALEAAAPLIAARALEEAADEVQRWRDEADERAEFPDTRTFRDWLRARAKEGRG